MKSATETSINDQAFGRQLVMNLCKTRTAPRSTIPWVGEMYVVFDYDGNVWRDVVALHGIPP